ncbi:hypothetical protein Enr13x_34180 [Stieleria neptunia]|uniref:VWFA domain-containing protein n=1 Tax=Stieleria neptunia TaxID=2527979 RepID=A0A518HRY2_9BACT|nr:BatA and WFA domain-containing protein [Stieleria neptunia]QDV43561.1 hypothetical protein Enr13x_34180 [Stieleria neptunia]
MGFLNPWAIAIGVLAVGAPVVVHFLTRPVPIEYPLSTIRLLSEVIQQRRARNRLRDWLILLMRIAAICLLAATFARPTLDDGPAVSRTAKGETARVIVLDVSQSMAAGNAGAQRFAQGRSAAIEFLDGTRGLQAAVVFAGAKPRTVFDQISPNLLSLRGAVEEAVVRPEQADANAGLQLAARILSDAKAEKRELVIISDFQRSNWGTASLDGLPEETDVQFHAVTSTVADNLAITDVRFAQQPIIGQPAQLEVEVANYSDHDKEIVCHVNLDRWQQRLVANVPARGMRTLSQSLTMDEAGWINGDVSLVSNLDVLSADDSRPLTVEVRDTPGVVLLSRQSELAVPSSSWYLQQALNVTLARADGGTAVTRIDPMRIHSNRWPVADLFVIDHPGTLDDDGISFLAANVRRGRGLLYVTSELADAMNLKRLSESLGSGFQPPVRLMSESASRSRKDLFISRVSARREPFRTLGGAVESALRPVRFSGGLPTTNLGEGLSDQVLAELSDSSALLYVTSADAGKIGVLNADLGTSNWPFQATFVPILGELVGGLLRGGMGTGSVDCGDPFVRLLPPTVQEVESLVIRPATETTPAADEYGKLQTTGSSEDESSKSGGFVWAWEDPIGPGVYEVQQGMQTIMAVAMAAPALESDLQALDETVLKDRVGQGRRVAYSTPTSEETEDDRWWTWLIVACLMGLIAEVTVLRGFRV